MAGYLHRAMSWARWWVTGTPRPLQTVLDEFRLSREEAEAQRTGSALEDVFHSGRGRAVDKWVHYLPIYDRFFGPYRGTGVTMLELGVYKGGSLDMWREYFGSKATIFGIDIDPACAERVSPPNQVRIGSQDDAEFLQSVLAEMGAPDIVLDDGSHVAPHQMASFRCLWPALKNGGLYVIEDAHTSYWRPYGGRFGRCVTAVGLAKELIDDMHAWYHFRKERHVSKGEIAGLHVFDSVMVIEKGLKLPPGRIEIPGFA